VEVVAEQQRLAAGKHHHADLVILEELGQRALHLLVAQAVGPRRARVHAAMATLGRTLVGGQNRDAMRYESAKHPYPFFASGRAMDMIRDLRPGCYSRPDHRRPVLKSS